MVGSEKVVGLEEVVGSEEAVGSVGSVIWMWSRWDGVVAIEPFFSQSKMRTS